jgi:hypothetical protein
VDDQFTVLVLRDRAPRIDRTALRAMFGRNAGVAFSANRPSAIVGDDMLIFAAHQNLLAKPGIFRHLYGLIERAVCVNI